ncbi:hypothetical protein [Desulfitobacterium hafniense]|uniref:hypothetical protein n=1 Tax=Desulfitobacterium hafniense TaxID=49338 RepID=UPI0002D8F8A6|nr:hypothetical protein [Desulfitobacterium hafniense]
MGAAAAQVFGPSSPGFIILSLVLLAVVSWLGELIAGAVNKGQIAMMIRTGTTIVAILMVLGVAIQLLSKFFALAAGNT